MAKKEATEAAETETSSKKKEPKKLVLALLSGEKVITESSDEAREFFNQSRFGIIAENGKVELSLLEGLYLLEKGRLELKSDSGRGITTEKYIKKARKIETNL